MNHIDLNIVNGKIIVDGFPNTAKVIDVSNLQDRDIKRLADISLHHGDMIFALNCLKRMADEDTDRFMQEVLWKSAIIHYGKCFGSDSRSKLSIERILKGRPPIVRNFHQFIIDLRNKNIAHDDNPFSICTVGAIVNKPEISHKIELITVMNSHAHFHTQDAFDSLISLIEMATKWIIAEQDILTAKITATLEQWEYSDLLDRKEIAPLKEPLSDDVTTKKSEYLK